ncbi:putative cytosolic iron-sulfur protein assembly protein 1 [Cladophialophora carrionii]|uniref:Probable cytosolic iron-sulfur protein assembly protein 1 n=1 Tax=Cladophialophora carrionii TaxID=86049 RepID=A0A1C1C7Y7_9EURO|nr:putative cytosolic iron-sulfur protein assembly protein 1 [Cladophialophora carrionii]
MADHSTIPSPSPLSLLHTLHHPGSGSTRSWQSVSHPDPSTPLLATASADKSVNIYSLRDFSLVSTISGGHKRSVRTVAWKDFGRPKKNGRRKPVVLGTGSFDANVGIWVWNDERRRAQLGLEVEGAEMGDSHAPKSEDAIETDMNDDTEEWHFSTLLTGPDSEIKSIDFSPPHYPANILATSSRDKSVWIWEEVEPEEWETIAVLSEHTGDVKCVGWCTGAKRRKVLKRRSGVAGEQGDGDLEMGNGSEAQVNGLSSSTQHGSAEDGDEEDEIVGVRPILASGSYDDTIRLWRDVEEEGDWLCVAVIASHTGTVWDLKWEGHINYSVLDIPRDATAEEEHAAIRAFEDDWQPRIVSCSDDLTVRIWRRELSAAEKEKRRQQRQTGAPTTGAAPMGFASSRIPSVIRPMSAMENWVEDAILPQAHVRSVYAVDWSRRTGLVVSCGGDGTIAVYREVAAPAQEGGDVVMNGTAAEESSEALSPETRPAEESEPYQLRKSTWEIVALMEVAHDEYEINHVCWAERRDKDRRFDGEEIIVSTGDEGAVRIWALPEDLVRDVQ